MQSSVMLILLLLGFFGLQMIHYGFLDYVYLLLVLVLAYTNLQSKSSYSKPIILYTVFVLVSCIYSWKFNSQSLFKVIGHSYDYFALIFFFHLMKGDLNYKQAEKVLFIVSLCFCFAYILQWLMYPTVVFSGAAAEAKANAFKYRVRMPGSICGYFLLLYSINKYLLDKKIIYIGSAVLAFIPIIIQGFRSLVSFSVLSAFLIIPFVSRKSIKSVLYAVFGAFVVFLFSTTSLVQDKVEEMMRRQENEQTFENQDYIRYLSFDYYWNNQFTKPYEKIIGGGLPVDNESKYKKEITTAIEYYSFYWVDLGIVGLSMVIGIPAVLLLVYIYCICMWKCKEPPLQYIRFTLFVVLASSIFTSMELYRGGNLLLLSLFLYIEYKYHQEKKLKDDNRERSKRLLRMHGLPERLRP